MITQELISAMVDMAIKEDVGSGDITAELLSDTEQAQATIVTRESMILCGCDFAQQVFAVIDREITVDWLFSDGDAVKAGEVFCRLSGSAKSILTAERCALNFLQMLSGTATSVNQYVNAMEGHQTKLLDTRKTIPGFRLAQKYAVTCGGGMNHRVGLFDAYLIKENHIMACGSIAAAVSRAKENHPGKTVEIEVENIDELQQALSAGADVIMLDNFSLESIKQAVTLVDKKVKLEVSGNVTLETIEQLAATGVDYISVGALTKHIHAVDLSLRIGR